MTTERLRALDAIDPPDQWDDIVARAAESGAASGVADAPLRTGGRRSRRALAVAAVLLVVVAIAGALVLTRPHGGEAPPVDEPPVDWPAKDDPAEIWGHEWQLVEIVAGDAAEREQVHVGDGVPLRLDLSEPGRFSLTACNTWTGEASTSGDLFLPTGGSSTLAACLDPLERLVDLLFSAPSRIDLRGTDLVLTQIPDPRVDGEAPRAVGPQLSFGFTRTDALTFREQFWGRAWQVTALAEPGGTEREVDEEGMAPIGATTVGRIDLPECGNPWALFDADTLERQGDWSVWRGSCPYGPAGHEADVRLVRAILTDVDGAEVDDGTVEITSPAGTLRARSVPVSTERQPEGLYGDRWVVVAADDGAERVDLPADLVLDARGADQAVTLPACAGVVGGPSELVEEGVSTRLRVERTPESSRGDCYGSLARVFPFFDALFAGEPELVIYGNRASLAIAGKQVTLMRIGPI